MIEDKRLLKRILKFLFADHSFKLYFFYSVVSIVTNRFWTRDEDLNMCTPAMFEERQNPFV